MAFSGLHPVRTTTTSVTVPAGGASTLGIAANPGRKSISLYVATGTLTAVWAVPAVVGSGIPYGSSGVAAMRTWGSADGVPIDALNLASTSGATVIIEEGA